ncbi:MAG: DinB family protein [Acidobacteriota bacterium]
MVFVPPRHARIRRSIRRCLTNQDRVDALLAAPDRCATSAPDVSGWSVGQQVEHLTTVDAAVLDGIDRLIEGDGGPGRLTPQGWVLILSRRIPRGRAKAPDAVRPRGAEAEQVIERAASNRRRLTEHLDRVRELARVRLTRPHPILGGFDIRRWILFLDIHERHHLAIVDDILRATRR